MNEGELWYIVERHSNIRIHSEDGAVIYDNFDRAIERADDCGKTSNQYIPITVAKYNEIYG